MKKTSTSKSRLRAIREWSTRIVKPKKEPAKKSADASEIADDTNTVNSIKQDTNRRLKDTIYSQKPNRKLNLDRRARNSERRINMNTNSNYNGPVRRYTIDRRLNLKDRREKD